MKVKFPKSLSKLCLKCIIRKMKCNFAATRWVDELEINNHNPFHQLPTILLEEIAKMFFCHMGCVGERVLTYLTTPQIKNLSIGVRDEEEILMSWFSNFEKLEVLHMSGTNVGDHCLEILGMRCNNLRVLNIGYCSRVTDTGIKWLCFGVESLRHCSERKMLCQSLQLLNLVGTRVTKIGIQMALKNLFALKVLSHDFTMEVLREIAQRAIDQNVHLPKYLLTSLTTSDCSPYISDSFFLALSLCPSLVEVIINLKEGFTDSDLLCLKHLKMLRELRIPFYRRPGESVEITFQDGVAPLLKMIGASLLVFELSCFDVVNIWFIIEFCPNLLSLTISNTPGFKVFWPDKEVRILFETARINKEKLFLTELVHLHLDCSFEIPSDVLLYLFSSPSLIFINISRCDSLTDVVFRDAIKRHRFRNLESLQLSRCNSMTHRVIDDLIIDDNSFKKIKISACSHLTIKHESEWVEKARKKNKKFKTNFVGHF